MCSFQWLFYLRGVQIIFYSPLTNCEITRLLLLLSADAAYILLYPVCFASGTNKVLWPFRFPQYHMPYLKAWEQKKLFCECRSHVSSNLFLYSFLSRHGCVRYIGFHEEKPNPKKNRDTTLLITFMFGLKRMEETAVHVLGSCFVFSPTSLPPRRLRYCLCCCFGSSGSSCWQALLLG